MKSVLSVLMTLLVVGAMVSTALALEDPDFAFSRMWVTLTAPTTSDTQAMQAAKFAAALTNAPGSADYRCETTSKGGGLCVPRFDNTKPVLYSPPAFLAQSSCYKGDDRTGGRKWQNTTRIVLRCTSNPAKTCADAARNASDPNGPSGFSLMNHSYFSNYCGYDNTVPGFAVWVNTYVPAVPSWWMTNLWEGYGAMLPCPESGCE